MNIKNGDVITLDNGQIVQVTLTPVEIIPIPGKKYRLRYTGEFCHWCNSNYTFETNNRKDLPNYTFQYIGEVDSNFGIRAIFFCKEKTSYAMFSMDSYNFITQELE